MDKKNLFKRGHMWYLKVAVPRTLVKTAGKREFVETTGTGDIHEARKVRDIRVPEIKREIALLKTGRPLPKESPEDELIEYIRSLRAMVKDDSMDDEQANHLLSDMIDKYIGDAHKGDRDAVPEEVVTRIRTASTLLGNYEGEFFNGLIEVYLEELAVYSVKSTVNARRNKLHSLRDWLKDKVFITDIKRADISKYQSQVLSRQGISQRTIKNHLGELSAFFNWCANKGYIENNIVTGIIRTMRTSSRAVEGDEGRRAWTEEELLLVLENLQEHPQRESWLPMFLIALYTGARRTEIAELKKSHASLKRLKVVAGKTKQARREVPVHKIIKPLIEYLMKSKGTYLIPDLARAGEDNKRGHYFSKNFSRFLRKKLKITDKDVVYHSLRNTFITGAANAGIPKEIRHRITGHKNTGEGETYIAGVKLKLLDEAMQKVTHGSTVDTAVKEAIKQHQQ